MLAVPGSPSVSPRSTTLRIQVKEGTALVVRDVPLEDYAAAAALSEVHPGRRRRGIRGTDVRGPGGPCAHLCAGQPRPSCAGTVSTCARPPIASSTSRRGWGRLDGGRSRRHAGRMTGGELIWFGDAPARAVFHADCGGHTSDAAAVWGGGAPPYLPAPSAMAVPRARARRVDVRGSGRGASRRAQRGPADRGRDETRSRSRSPAATCPAAPKRSCSAAPARSWSAARSSATSLTRAFGAKSLRSTLFTVKKTGAGFVFSGKGFGHGVGLCQAGAMARIRAGASVESRSTFRTTLLSIPGTHFADRYRDPRSGSRSRIHFQRRPVCHNPIHAQSHGHGGGCPHSSFDGGTRRDRTGQSGSDREAEARGLPAFGRHGHVELVERRLRPAPVRDPTTCAKPASGPATG